MHKIDLENLDELFEISAEIGILTYLQDLVKSDIDERVINRKGLDNFANEALTTLVDKQYTAVSKLWELLDSKNFPK